MLRSSFLRGVSAGALALSFVSSMAVAQEMLPIVDIGASQAAPTQPLGAGIVPAPGGAAAKDGGGRFTGYEVEAASSALKTDAPIKETPFSVQVVPRQTIDDQQAVTLQDAIGPNVSGVTGSSPVTGFETFTVRGFNIGQNIYRNGLRETINSATDMGNVQSIEVVKGPVAALYGRIEPGGLIDLVLKRPLDQQYTSVQEQAGSYGFTRTSVDVTGPLNADKTLSYRVNADYQHSDSFRDFVDSENVFVAPTLSYRPNDRIRLNVDFEFQRRTFVDDNNGLVAIGNRPASIPISAYLGDPSIQAESKPREDRRLVAYDLSIDLTKDWNFTHRFYNSNNGYTDSQVSVASVNQLTGVAGRTLLAGQFAVNTTSTNFDLKGKFDTGPLHHSVLIGMDYYNSDSPVSPLILTFGFQNIPSPTNIYGPNPWGTGFPYKSLPGNVWQINTQEWTGIYGQDMISLLDDRVHVLLGGRYDWAHQGSAFYFNSNPILGPLLAQASYVNPSDQAFSPRAGVAFDVLPWLTVYGNYSQSLGANNGVTSNSQPLAPQKGVQYEVGAKAEFLDKRLLATLALYDITKTNVPTPDPVNPAVSDVIGKARSKGVELDVTGRVTENWSLIANYSHIDARVTQGALYNPVTEITTENAVAGNQLPSVPLNSGNLWAKYDANGALKGLSAAGGVNIVGAAQGDNANSFRLPTHAIVNSMLAYRFAIGGTYLTAQLNVKNLLDTTYYSSALTRFSVIPGAPRTVLGSLRIEF